MWFKSVAIGLLILVFLPFLGRPVVNTSKKIHAGVLFPPLNKSYSFRFSTYGGLTIFEPTNFFNGENLQDLKGAWITRIQDGDYVYQRRQNFGLRR